MNDYGFNEKYQFTITQDPENDQRKENLITSIEPVEPKKKAFIIENYCNNIGMHAVYVLRRRNRYTNSR